MEPTVSFWTEDELQGQNKNQILQRIEEISQTLDLQAFFKENKVVYPMTPLYKKKVTASQAKTLYTKLRERFSSEKPQTKATEEPEGERALPEAAEKAEQEKLEAQKKVADKKAQEKPEQELIAAQATEEKAAEDKHAEQERLVAQEKVAEEKAERVAAEKAANKKVAEEKAEQERIAQEQLVAQEKAAADKKAEQEYIAQKVADRAEEQRLTQEKAAAVKAAADKKVSEEKAEQEHIAAQKRAQPPKSSPSSNIAPAIPPYYPKFRAHTPITTFQLPINPTIYRSIPLPQGWQTRAASSALQVTLCSELSKQAKKGASILSGPK